MRSRIVARWLGLLACAFIDMSAAQDIDVQQLVRDTQISRQEGQALDLVWYIPTEFWQASFKKGGNLTEKQQRDMLSTVEDYVLVAAIEGNIGPLGALSSTSKDELEKKISLKLGDAALALIPEAELPAATSNFVQMMKPVISNMLGAIGSGLHFIVFESKDAKGKRLVDPTKEGRLTIRMGEKDFSFRLPIGALLPPMFDAQTGDRFPGDYIYNPYTGKKLAAK